MYSQQNLEYNKKYTRFCIPPKKKYIPWQKQKPFHTYTTKKEYPGQNLYSNDSFFFVEYKNTPEFCILIFFFFWDTTKINIFFVLYSKKTFFLGISLHRIRSGFDGVSRPKRFRRPKNIVSENTKNVRNMDVRRK